MQHQRTCVVFLLTLCLTGRVNADGLIHQLPETGAWVRYNVDGDGIVPDGTVTVTVRGTQTFRSVGRAMADESTSSPHSSSPWLFIHCSHRFGHVEQGESVGRNPKPCPPLA